MTTCPSAITSKSQSQSLFTSTRRLCRSWRFSGGFISVMACTFLGSILYPAGVRFPPKNTQSWDLNTNLFALKVRLLTLAVSSRVMTATSWVVSSLPWQRISSTIPTLLGTLFSTLSILSWKTSPDTFSPKGRRSHRHLPQGVLKVVRKLLSLSRETCQYPDSMIQRFQRY